ncbi:MAG: hypothetical protein EZS28_019021 [Streblomastix strix]|uniref:Uncharacterized protein n=1 Tax=Streblomastix strix TaxID=222440 RepID=A0A5J4VS89_9EUKA|nr:MAG: hypothetical protein EZS28_019021 [Streblomastix strix]
MAERKWALDLVNFDDVEQHVSLQKQKLDQRDKVVDALPSVAPSFLSVTFTTTAAICQAVEDQKGDQELQTKEMYEKKLNIYKEKGKVEELQLALALALEQ